MSGPDPLTVPALAARLRRYCFAYTASHDPSVCDDIMVPEYALHMGEFEIRGRDGHYRPAAERQYRQFPGLGMSVHQLLVTPQRAALHFSEYGRSALSGTVAAWSGISLYRWDGDRLTECRVEQDYYARRRQLQSEPNPLEQPAYDPWTAAEEQPDPAVEATTRRWLTSGGIARLPPGSLDDEYAAAPARVVLEDAAIEILDCFAGAERAAFHVAATGTATAGPEPADALLDRVVTLYCSGIARVREGRVTAARVISDRLAVERRAAAVQAS